MSDATKSATSIDRFVRFPELQKTVGLSRAQIYLLISAGTFPKQVKLGEKASAWLHSEVVQWMEEKVSQYRCNGGAHASASQ